MLLALGLLGLACSSAGSRSVDALTVSQADPPASAAPARRPAPRPAAGAKPSPLPTMVRIAAGTTEQGCTTAQSASCWQDERPARPITLTRDFELSATEVTQEQYQAVVGDRGVRDCPEQEGRDRPMAGVYWSLVAHYTNLLSESQGLEACYQCTRPGDAYRCEVATKGSIYDCRGYRLPTEAEWEHAARCGTDYRYAGSDVLDEVAWHGGNSGGAAQPVGTKRPNGCGLYDLSGNVAELVHDHYELAYYASRPSVDPVAQPLCCSAVVRGGSAYPFGPDDPHRVSAREHHDFWTCQVGFRIARTLSF